MSESPRYTAKPKADHTYTVMLCIRSSRPYTTAELERLSSWWVFVKDRQVKVEQVTVKKKGEKKR